MEVRVSSSVVCFLCSLKFKLRFVAVESIDENIAFRRSRTYSTLSVN